MSEWTGPIDPRPDFLGQDPGSVRVVLVWFGGPSKGELLTLRRLHEPSAAKPPAELKSQLGRDKRLVLGEFPRPYAQQLAEQYRSEGFNVVLEGG